MRRERLACMGEAAVDDGQADLKQTVATHAERFIDPTVEEHPGVRATAHRALDELQVRSAGPAVSARAAGGPSEQDPNPWVRAAAVSALGSFGGPEALAALRRAVVGDPSQDVRLAAARELGELEDEAGATTEVLLEALRDEAPNVRLNARRALRRIHDADLGLDPRTWRTWLEQRGWRPPETETAPPEAPPPSDATPWGDPPPVDEPGQDPPPADEPDESPPQVDEPGQDPPPVDEPGQDPPPVDEGGAPR